MKERQLVYFRDGVAYLLPDPGQYRDERLQLAISIRNEATLAGRCPVCAATMQLPNRAARRRLTGKRAQPEMVHEPACPAGDDRLAELVLETGEAA